MALNSNPDYNEWMDIYKKLVYWELEMEKSDRCSRRKHVYIGKKKPVRSGANQKRCRLGMK